MTRLVNVHEAKTHLSRLLEAVGQGEDIVIARAGRPIARLVPVGPAVSRTAGAWRGQVEIANDFDETPVEVVRAFGGLAEEAP